MLVCIKEFTQDGRSNTSKNKYQGHQTSNSLSSAGMHQRVYPPVNGATGVFTLVNCTGFEGITAITPSKLLDARQPMVNGVLHVNLPITSYLFLEHFPPTQGKLLAVCRPSMGELVKVTVFTLGRFSDARRSREYS